MDILELIRQERKRQIKKGFDLRHDDKETKEELAKAAVVFAMPESYRDIRINFPNGKSLSNIFWPYKEDFKMSSNRKKDLIKAAALIVAEIERLNRLSKN